MKKRVFDRIMFRKVSVGKMKFRTVDLVFIFCLLVLAFLVRYPLFPIESADFYGFLKPWMQSIRENGGYRSLGIEISNYTSPYMYIMCLLSYISHNDLYALKMVSVLFDYVAAVTVLLLVCRLTGNVRKAILSMAFLLFSPAVVIDGAYWAQCDIIYAAFLLIALYFFFQNNSSRCLFFVAVAFSFKLQAVFIIPFLVIMWAKKKTVLLRHFIWLPVVYVISCLPAWALGRSFLDLLTIYVDQSGTYSWGTLEYPNMYAFLGEAMPNLRHAAEVSSAGLILTVMLLGGIAYYLYTKKVRLTDRLIVTLALLTVGVTVYTLPHMHERYGILLDLLAILYVMLDVRKLPVYFGFSVISVLSFMPYLIGTAVIPIQYVALGLLGLLLYVGYDLYLQIIEATKKPQRKMPGELQHEDPVFEQTKVQPPLSGNWEAGDDRIK